MSTMATANRDLDAQRPPASALHASSEITLPSTEVPASPLDPASSFKTEVNDDRPAVTVIPSSLTPPATVLHAMPDREPASEDYIPPVADQVMAASADELRALLHTCIAEHQKLKMEAAHHKLQFNLLTLQADEESKRAAVEHDMVHRQVDALRMAEHSRQARRDLAGASENVQSKYLQMKACYEAAVEENAGLHRRVKVAKKVIQQKEEETIGLIEEREILLNRIRENREHFRMLCSPGGIFHGALTPKHASNPSPPPPQQQQQQRQPQQQPQPQQQQQHGATPHRAMPRALRRDESDTREHGLSALLEAMNQSQDHASNNSAPTTPMVAAGPASRLMGRHHRNAQSMSSLPTTPMNRLARDGTGLLPSINLVAQTEPRLQYARRHFSTPSTPPLRRSSPRKSRESTISADDNESLARQAVESAKAAQSILAADAARQLGGTRSGHGLGHGSQQQERRDGEERHAMRAAARDDVRRARADDSPLMGEGAPASVPSEMMGTRGEKRKLDSDDAARDDVLPMQRRANDALQDVEEIPARVVSELLGDGSAGQTSGSDGTGLEGMLRNAAEGVPEVKEGWLYQEGEKFAKDHNEISGPPTLGQGSLEYWKDKNSLSSFPGKGRA